MHDLTTRVHTAVGAAGTDQIDGFIGDQRQRLLETLLHAEAALLALPAVVTRAVVFDAERDANVTGR